MEDQNRLQWRPAGGLRAQLPVRLPVDEGRRPRDVQEHGVGAVPDGEAGRARARHHRRHRPGRGRVLEAQASRRSRRSSACARRENQIQNAVLGGLPPVLDVRVRAIPSSRRLPDVEGDLRHARSRRACGPRRRPTRTSRSQISHTLSPPSSVSASDLGDAAKPHRGRARLEGAGAMRLAPAMRLGAVADAGAADRAPAAPAGAGCPRAPAPSGGWAGCCAPRRSS